MNQNNISLETVLHALYGCSNVQSGFTGAVYVCPTCAYGKDDGRPCESLHPLLDDAYALLKKQEPENAIVVQNGIDASGGWWYQCPNCKMEIEPRDNYRRTCGRAVKWE